MATEVLMPALSPTMTEGKIARWLKSEGDAVHSGDVLAEIETDKATMEVEAVDEGVLAKIVIPEGTDHVAVNTPIAVIAGNGEDVSADAPAVAQQTGINSQTTDTPRARAPQPVAPKHRAPPAVLRQKRRNTPALLARSQCVKRCVMRSPRRCDVTNGSF